MEEGPGGDACNDEGWVRRRVTVTRPPMMKMTSISRLMTKRGSPRLAACGRKPTSSVKASAESERSPSAESEGSPRVHVHVARGGTRGCGRTGVGRPKNRVGDRRWERGYRKRTRRFGRGRRLAGRRLAGRRSAGRRSARTWGGRGSEEQRHHREQVPPRVEGAIRERAAHARNPRRRVPPQPPQKPAVSGRERWGGAAGWWGGAGLLLGVRLELLHRELAVAVDVGLAKGLHVLIVLPLTPRHAPLLADDVPGGIEDVPWHLEVVDRLLHKLEPHRVDSRLQVHAQARRLVDRAVRQPRAQGVRPCLQRLLGRRLLRRWRLRRPLLRRPLLLRLLRLLLGSGWR